MSDAKYIDPDTMSDRQLWAVGALTERFYKAGNLDIVSAERDRDAQAFLEQAGYQPGEIALLVGHMNACVSLVKIREEITSGVELSIREGRHNPPAPQ